MHSAGAPTSECEWRHRTFYTKIGAERAPLCIILAQCLRLSIGEATVVGLVLLLIAMNAKW